MTPAKRQRIPIYEIRLVQSRRPLRLREETLRDPEISALAIHDLIGLTDREHLVCLFLDGHHKVTGAHIANIGGQHTIGTVDVRVVLRSALAACASAMILGHNHPSGDPRPSADDIACTARLMTGGQAISIPVLDHIIVTRDETRFHSMHEQGTLPRLRPEA